MALRQKMTAHIHFIPQAMKILMVISMTRKDSRSHIMMMPVPERISRYSWKWKKEKNIIWQQGHSLQARLVLRFILRMKTAVKELQHCRISSWKKNRKRQYFMRIMMRITWIYGIFRTKASRSAQRPKKAKQKSILTAEVRKNFHSQSRTILRPMKMVVLLLGNIR